MKIREAKLKDLNGWVQLRKALWPEYEDEVSREEAIGILESSDAVCFLAIADNEKIAGFAEAVMYNSTKGPYVHLEGWYMLPDHRQHGYGKKLVDSIGDWCLHRAINTLTSDTTPDYPLSPAGHKRAGFKKIHELTIFMKQL